MSSLFKLPQVVTEGIYISYLPSLLQETFSKDYEGDPWLSSAHFLKAAKEAEAQGRMYPI